MKQLARFSALAYKAKNNEIIVVEDFTFDTPKTKEFVAIQNNLKVNGKRSLLVIKEENKNVYLSSRNVPKSEVLTYNELNTYSIMKAGSLVLSEGSIAELNNLLNA